MVYFYGAKKKKAYFEGWYFKHCNGANSIAFIPGMSIDENGKKSAFIQVIANEFSDYYIFDYSLFYASKNELYIKIGDNEFSKKGVKINLPNIKGELMYGEFTPLKYKIMGPFSYIPFMECRHEVISLFHYVRGKISVSEREYVFEKGISYIEKDFGTSFPKKYIWVQCNEFSGEKMCVTLSVAHIPFLGGAFTGCICSVYHKNKEFRLATYKGVKILCFTDRKVSLQQGKYKLEVQIEKSPGKQLFAPKSGDMVNKIKENIACVGRFIFFENEKCVFDIKSENVSFEYEG